MGDARDAFYIVRKGDVVGVYRSLSDCQAQLGSSVCDPSVSVFKGYCLPKEAEEYLAAHGLRNANYSIGAADVKDDLFGQLVACPYQQPASAKRRVGTVDLDLHGYIGGVGSTSNAQRKHVKLDNHVKIPSLSSNCLSCTLEFDGASKGNPGLAGAGAVLRVDNSSIVYRLREGVGIATNNVAEYRAVILGLRYALRKGFKHIRVQGDSNLVCMQVQGLWKTKNQNMADLCKVAKDLKDKFTSFQITHIGRDFNSEADAQANLAIFLKDGEVQDECEKC